MTITLLFQNLFLVNQRILIYYLMDYLGIHYSAIYIDNFKFMRERNLVENLVSQLSCSNLENQYKRGQITQA